jgi:hypothetical protein
MEAAEMQVTNIRNHRIRWRVLVAQGALAGAISAAVMLLIAALLFPLFKDGADVWSFEKVVSSSILGDDVATPLSGFELGPVLLGLVEHLAIGVLAGISYALLVAMFDLEGWTPVTLFGLLYGAMLFVWSTAIIQAGLTSDSAAVLPTVVMFWGNLFFGITCGIVLATWADRADLDQQEDERVPVFEGQQDQARLLH